MEDSLKKVIKVIKKGRSAKQIGHSCFSIVDANRERIWDMRGINMTWREIANYLGISESALHRALKLVKNEAEHRSESNPQCARLMLHFNTEAHKEWFKRGIRALQRNEPLPPEPWQTEDGAIVENQ